MACSNLCLTKPLVFAGVGVVRVLCYGASKRRYRGVNGVLLIMSSIPSSNLISLTFLMYGLHLFSAVTGILSPAFILTAFLTGWPSIIAVILNYAKRNDVQGTYLQSHFTWQLRTFWFAVLWMLLSAALAITFFGIPLALVLVFITGLWVLYRIVHGLMRLMDEQPMPV